MENRNPCDGRRRNSVGLTICFARERVNEPRFQTRDTWDPRGVPLMWITYDLLANYSGAVQLADIWLGGQNSLVRVERTPPPHPLHCIRGACARGSVERLWPGQQLHKAAFHGDKHLSVRLFPLLWLPFEVGENVISVGSCYTEELILLSRSSIRARGKGGRLVWRSFILGRLSWRTQFINKSQGPRCSRQNHSRLYKEWSRHIMSLPFKHWYSR